jgi:Cobalamin synthesis protein cobW C-terminal domain
MTPVPVSNYDELINVLIARRDELRVSHETIDAIAGWADGMTSKALGPARRKTIGMQSLWLALPALGLRLEVVEDEDATRRMARRWVPRRELWRRVGNSAHKLGVAMIARAAKELGARGACERAAKLAPARRQELARAAGIARWASVPKQQRREAMKELARTRWAVNIGSIDFPHKLAEQGKLHDGDEHGHEHHHRGHPHHNHLQNIDTICIEQPGALDGLKVSTWFRSLIGEFGDRVLRMKAILNLKGDNDQFLLQGVHWDFEGRPGRSWAAAEERINRIVFIGRKLDKEKITQGFANCFYTEGSRDPATDKDPFGRYIEISPYTLEQIRYWMRQNFNLGIDVPIVIKEVPCIKEACPPIETSIMVMEKNAPPRAFKVQRPINEITFDHVYNLIENPMPCC